MHTMRMTDRQVVLVRDASGNVLHTHEVVYFDNAAPMDDSALHREAVRAALALHTSARESELRPVTSSQEEVDKMRRGVRPGPRPASEAAGGKIC